jgi:hypothetical protein
VSVFIIPKSSHRQYDFLFDGGSRCHIDTCYLYPNEDVVFGILKASHLVVVVMLGDGGGGGGK